MGGKLPEVRREEINLIHEASYLCFCAMWKRGYKLPKFGGRETGARQQARTPRDPLNARVAFAHAATFAQNRVGERVSTLDTGLPIAYNDL